MITKIKNEFDVRIDLVDSTTEDGEEIVTAMVEGTKLGCEGAKERILEMVDEMVKIRKY